MNSPLMIVVCFGYFQPRNGLPSGQSSLEKIDTLGFDVFSNTSSFPRLCNIRIVLLAEDSVSQSTDDDLLFQLNLLATVVLAILIF